MDRMRIIFFERGRERRRRHEEGARDLFRRQAADLAQRHRDLRVRPERRVAAGEHEAQPVVRQRLVHRVRRVGFLGGEAFHDVLEAGIEA